MSNSERRRNGAEGRVKGKYIPWGGNWCRDFDAKCPSCCQPVLKTSTGTHPFFNHQQTPEGRDVAPFYVSDDSTHNLSLNFTRYSVIFWLALRSNCRSPQRDGKAESTWVARWFACRMMVTHLSTNRARRRSTSSLSQTAALLQINRNKSNNNGTHYANQQRFPACR